MKNNEWIISEDNYDYGNTAQNGSKYLIANGYMGYRGTFEEFGKKELAALNLAGLFDKNGDSWRESVNAPDPFFTKLYINGEEVSLLTRCPCAHSRTLDIRHGVHRRTTSFNEGGASVTVTAERFLSMSDEHIGGLSYTVSADKPITVTLKTDTNCGVWDINGPHFTVTKKDIFTVECETVETKTQLAVCTLLSDKNLNSQNGLTVDISPEKPYNFKKLFGVYWGKDFENRHSDFEKSAALGYDELLENHKSRWEEIWDMSDVVIEGDDEAQKALRYSLYQLISIAPRGNHTCGIPARGLSGQVYKGAAFWDTEMFMQPFFSFTNPAVAKKLAEYRINTIDGARRKAAEYGYEGAFYAWESQETGDDACTLFNITDVFTKRPIRTYFRDKQIHISADTVYGLWEYCNVSGEYSILADGGLEMIYECVRFFYCYAYTKPFRKRYELLDVVGPDEYHERVNNNAYTNKIAKRAVDILISALEKAKSKYPEFYRQFEESHSLDWIKDFGEALYVPAPDRNGIIEQFDGYFKLEDIDLNGIKKRVIDPNEYWGCGQGIAATTRVIKQADVLMMLNVFRREYSKEVLEANWRFYEPYTEGGSSLSACAYAIVAANIGNIEWAYKYFMKTATVDLTGDTRQYLGTLYIGGTHPAANGGSWSTAIFGFAGVSYDDDTIDISPHLPRKWKSLSFKLLWKGKKLNVHIENGGVSVKCDGSVSAWLTVNGKKYNSEENKNV